MQGTSLNSDSALLRRSHAMAVALLVATVLTVVRDIAAEFAVATGREDEARDALALMPVVRRYGAGDAVMIFSPTHSIAFPLILEADVRWTSRYVSMWPMRAFYDARMAGDKSFADLEKRFIRDVVDDMTRAPPRLIVVDAATTRLAEDHGVSGLGYFERDPRFASLLTEYDRVADVRRYRVFRRNRSSPRPR
jgi:hypothetical protein